MRVKDIYELFLRGEPHIFHQKPRLKLKTDVVSITFFHLMYEQYSPRYFNDMWQKLISPLEAPDVGKNCILRAKNKVTSCYFPVGAGSISLLQDSDTWLFGKAMVTSRSLSLQLAGCCPQQLGVSWNSAAHSTKPAWMAGTYWCRDRREHNKVFELKMPRSCRTWAHLHAGDNFIRPSPVWAMTTTTVSVDLRLNVFSKLWLFVG